ncbi:MAG: peptidase [Candidatus Muproteobacteria bacterium RBG_19FT_COMBO_61_10]|jgi:Zn-dependent protease|uniref:Peptidase n=1 Tax=Candidatus Muproteobacteria bacterium RBG_19FT_COMBO_61_10 TaxID=1817761 RepID=A0A1F6UIB2_9PROT|nr:MAG: peptidase [Candidatus Muproteobacteria bacterium RBG_19FT_COMBO_61_10]
MLEQIFSILSRLTEPQLISILVLPVLFAIIVHEVAHGWVAKLLGDPTAERLGRLTLNPVKHIDPIGTLLVPALLVLLRTGFVFGWAKPVPITWENLRHPKRDMALVAAAGPVANLLMAVLWGLVVKISILLPLSAAPLSEPMKFMGLAGILANVLLMVFNLLPLPPLDGGRVAVGLLPGPWAWRLSQVEPYGLIILIGLMVSGLLWWIIGPVAELVAWVVVTVVGL